MKITSEYHYVPLKFIFDRNKITLSPLIENYYTPTIKAQNSFWNFVGLTEKT